MNLDLGTVIAAKEIVGYGLGALDGGQCTLRGVPGEDVDYPAHLTKLIAELASWIKREVARTAAGIDAHGRRAGRPKHSAFGIETKNEHLVQAKVRDDDKAVVW